MNTLKEQLGAAWGTILPRWCIALLALAAPCGAAGPSGPAPVEERVQAQLDLARGYLEQRDFARARLPLERALKIDGRHVEARVLYAVLLQVENEHELAEEQFRLALDIDPDHAQALNNYGSFLYARGRYADALEPLSRLVKDTSYRARPQAFENLGLAQVQINDLDAAGASFQRALELNERQARSALELADIALARGNLDSAVRYFDQYRRYAKPNARSLCLGMRLSAARGDDNQTASYGLALKNLFPDQADACQIKS